MANILEHEKTCTRRRAKDEQDQDQDENDEDEDEQDERIKEDVNPARATKQGRGQSCRWTAAAIFFSQLCHMFNGILL